MEHRTTTSGPTKKRVAIASDNHREHTAILVVSDQPVVRRGLKSILEEQPGWSVVAAACGRQDAVMQASRSRPDIVIVDINMPNLDGAAATRSILKEMPDMRVLAVSASYAEGIVHAALDAGVLGCVSKSNSESELILAINTLLQGRTFFAAPMFKRIRDLWHRQSRDPSKPPLNDRETKIVRLLTQGRNNREVADALGIGVRTVEDLRSRIMQKLGLKRFCELVHYAVRNGIVEP